MTVSGCCGGASELLVSMATLMGLESHKLVTGLVGGLDFLHEGRRTSFYGGSGQGPV